MVLMRFSRAVGRRFLVVVCVGVGYGTLTKRRAAGGTTKTKMSLLICFDPKFKFPGTGFGAKI